MGITQTKLTIMVGEEKKVLIDFVCGIWSSEKNKHKVRVARSININKHLRLMQTRDASFSFFNVRRLSKYEKILLRRVKID